MTDHLDILADFHAACASLIEPMEVTDPRGHTGTVGSVVAQVEDGRPPVSDDSFAAMGFKGSPPLWLAGLDWLRDVQRTVTGLADIVGLHVPHVADLSALLDWAASAPWPPSAGSRLTAAADRLNGYRDSGLRLIYPELFTVDAPCPDCRAETVNAPAGDGGVIRRSALVMRELWLECSACSAEWWGADIMRAAAAVQAADDAGPLAA